MRLWFAVISFIVQLWCCWSYFFNDRRVDIEQKSPVVLKICVNGKGFFSAFVPRHLGAFRACWHRGLISLLKMTWQYVDFIWFYFASTSTPRRIHSFSPGRSFLLRVTYIKPTALQPLTYLTTSLMFLLVLGNDYNILLLYAKFNI